MEVLCRLSIRTNTNTTEPPSRYPKEAEPCKRTPTPAGATRTSLDCGKVYPRTTMAAHPQRGNHLRECHTQDFHLTIGWTLGTQRTMVRSNKWTVTGYTDRTVLGVCTWGTVPRMDTKHPWCTLVANSRRRP